MSFDRAHVNSCRLVGGMVLGSHLGADDGVTLCGVLWCHNGARVLRATEARRKFDWNSESRKKMNQESWWHREPNIPNLHCEHRLEACFGSNSASRIVQCFRTQSNSLWLRLQTHLAWSCSPEVLSQRPKVSSYSWCGAKYTKAGDLSNSNCIHYLIEVRKLLNA